MARSVCARLGSGHVQALLGRMMAVMPDPLTVEDRQAGFDWRFSVAQLEVSDTAVFDAPRRGRAWFEAAIGDHLDLGRPERVSLVVDRKVINRGKSKTPGRFATEVITRDVAPQLQIHYKSSKVKAYLKEGRALRVETTINNATDFGPSPWIFSSSSAVGGYFCNISSRLPNDPRAANSSIALAIPFPTPGTSVIFTSGLPTMATMLSG